MGLKIVGVWLWDKKKYNPGNENRANNALSRKLEYSAKISTFHNNSGMSNAGWAIASSNIPLARSVSDKDLSNSAYLLHA